MPTFDFYLPTRILFGPGRLRDLEHTPFLPKGSRALIVVGAGGSMLTEGHLARVQGLLAARGVASMVYDRIPARLEADAIHAAAAHARAHHADYIVGLGGGRVIDAAKGIAFMACNAGQVWDQIDGGSEQAAPEAETLPVLAIPTTAGTGAEVTNSAVVARSKAAGKRIWRHALLFPRLAVVDPELTVSIPAEQTAYAGLGALGQAMDTLLSMRAQPTADMLALEAVQMISRSLGRAVADGGDREARTLLMWAGSAAGLSAALAGAGPLQSLALTLDDGNFIRPHGAAHMLLTEAYVQRIGARRPERLDLLTRAMGGGENGGPDDGAARFRSAWKALTGAIGLAPEMGPTRCCTKAQLDRWTGNALASMGGHPEAAWRAMRKSDMEAVITEALGAGDVSRTGT